MSIENPQRVTLTDLGRQLNLSKRAVAQALNDKPSTVRISEATRRRVRELAEKLNFRPDRVSQILRTGKSGTVGIMMPQGFSSVLQEQLYFSRDHTTGHGLLPYTYLLPDISDASCSRAINMMIDARVDGLVTFGEFIKPYVKRLREIGLPLVSIGAPNIPGANTYYPDRVNGFYSLTRHLADQLALRPGASSLYLVTPPEHQWHYLCARTGFRKAARKARTEGSRISFKIQPHSLPSDLLTRKEAPDIHPFYAGGYLIMKELLASDNVPDALIFSSDNLAQGALLACTEAGIGIPDELMIAGFGDHASSSAGSLPLTSIRQPIDELVRLAIDDLALMIAGNRTAIKSRQSVKRPCKLVIRASTLRPAPDS